MTDRVLQIGRRQRPGVRWLLAVGLAVLTPANGFSHGFVGDRFFPATLLTDDPFVADEMSLPTLSRDPTEPDHSQAIHIGAAISKTITPDIGVTLSDQWKWLQPKGSRASGLGALDAEVDYQFFKNDPHEAVAMAGINTSFAHTGRVQALDAPDFTTISPVLDLGKGFGDLPEAVPWLRPFAITGNLSIDFPTKTESAGAPNPDNFNYDFAFEYSLEYLQHQVKDIGLTAPFDRLIPLVEVSLTTPLNRTPGGQTIGTIQPGLIWVGDYMQIGAEAIIPVNRDTARGFGGLIQLHFYLDDLFPSTIGRPLLEL